MANGAGPSPRAELEILTPSFDAPEPERADLEQTAARSYELLDAVAAALRSQIAMEQAGREEHEEMVRASKARETQLKRTLATIETRANAEEKREQRGRGSGERKGARRVEWTPSPGKLAEMWEVVLAYGREHARFTQTQLADSTPGLSPEALRKGLVVFREHELVRVAGKVRGGGNAWALMPEAEERGAGLWHAST